MFDSIKNFLKKDSYSLKKYLTKDEKGISLLERLLKDDITLEENEEKKLKNSIDACYLYVKYDKELFNFDLTEDQFFTEIEGKLLIEHIIESFCFGKYEIIKKIKNHVEIVDLIIEKDKYLLYQLSDEIKDKLLEEKNNEYLIEKYFNDSFILLTLIKIYDNPLPLLNICKKKGKLNILKYSNIDALMTNIDSSFTLLEYLLSINIIPNLLEILPHNDDFIRFIVNKGLYKYIKNNDETILNIEMDNNKIVLELLIEKDLLKELNFTVFQEKTIEVLYKYNKMNLINRIDCMLLNKECKVFNIDSNMKLIDYLLENNYSFSFFESNKKSEKEIKNIINNLYDKKEYSIIGKSLNGDYLLYEVEPGITLIDKLLEENIEINFGTSEIESVIIAKKIFNKNRINLLVKVNLDLLMRLFYDNKCYLEHILIGLKSKNFKCNLNNICFHKYSINTLAKFYLYVAKYDMINYLDNLKEKDLLRVENGRTLLDRLLSYDRNLTLNKILSKKNKSNLKITSYLKNKGINLENIEIDIPTKKTNFVSDYMEKENIKKGIGPIFEEGEYLLKRLQELFINDGKSDEQLINALINGYRSALINNYEINIRELENLIKIKENNLNLRYLKKNDRGYFSKFDEIICSSQPIINILFHETGHALHWYLASNKYPDNYEEIVKKVINNPETIKKVKEFSDKYYNIREEFKKLAKEKYKEYYKDYYNIEKNNEIIDFLLKEKEEKKEEFKLLDIDDDIIEAILNEKFTSEEYIKTQKRIFIEEQSDAMMREKYGAIGSISDIIDAIYEGEFKSEALLDENGEVIRNVIGHGIPYYSCKTDFCFCEVIANFSALLKSKDCNDLLELLKNIIGDELYNLISDFYYNNIVYNKDNAKTL